MKQSVLRALAFCLTTAFAAGYAYAKDDTDSSKSSQSTQSSDKSQGGPGSSSGAYHSTSASHMGGKSTRLSKLMHTNIKGQSGESLGQVQDLIIDADSGQIQFVVLSPSGASAGAPGSSSSTTSGVGTSATTGTADASGIGSTSRYGASGSLVAVPWRLMTQSGMDQFTLNVDPTKLQSAPSFSASSWPTMDSSWSQRVYSHFGVDANSATGAPGSSSGSTIGTPPGSGTSPTPGLPSTPGTPDINSPSSGTGAPGTGSDKSGTGLGTGSSGTRGGSTGSSGSSGSSGSGAGK